MPALIFSETPALIYMYTCSVYTAHARGQVNQDFVPIRVFSSLLSSLYPDSLIYFPQSQTGVVPQIIILVDVPPPPSLWSSVHPKCTYSVYSSFLLSTSSKIHSNVGYHIQHCPVLHLEAFDDGRKPRWCPLSPLAGALRPEDTLEAQSKKKTTSRNFFRITLMSASCLSPGVGESRRVATSRDRPSRPCWSRGKATNLRWSSAPLSTTGGSRTGRAGTSQLLPPRLPDLFPSCYFPVLRCRFLLHIQASFTVHKRHALLDISSIWIYCLISWSNQMSRDFQGYSSRECKVLRLKGSNYISTILKLRHTVTTVSLDMMDNQHFE